MTDDDVHGDDMTHPELSDEQLAALLEGRSAGIDGHPVADALGRAREQLAAEPVPTPGAALSEFLGVGRVTEPIPRSTQAADVIDVTDEVDPTPRRIPVLTSITAFIGTLSGKVLVGTTVAAASIGGAHATGVVDIPLLPDVDDAAVVETIDDPDEADDLDVSDDDSSSDDGDSDESGEDSDSDDSADDSDDSDSDDSDSDDSDDDSDDSDDDSDDSDDDSDDSDDDSDDSDDSDDDRSTPTTTVTTPTTAAPTTSTTTTTMPSTSTTTAPSSSTTKAYSVAGVGTTTVTVTGFQISLVSAVPAAGWTLDEAGPDADGVESRYVNGDLEVRIDFEIEDGQLRVRVREENDATDERSERFEYFPLS